MHEVSTNILRRFLAGELLALSAMGASQVLISWWITLEGGASDLTVYAALAAAAACVAIPATAVLSDLYEKRRLIHAGLTLQLLSTAVLALQATLHIYDFRLILAMEVLSVVGFAGFTSAASVWIADLLPASASSRLMQWQRLLQSCGQLAGPLAGAAALAWSSIAAALWVQAAVYLLAIATMIQAPSRRATASALPIAWLSELRAGLRIKWRIVLERNWTLISFLVAVFLVPATGVLLPLKVHALGLSGEWLGLCEAGLSLGMLLGSGVGLTRGLIRSFGRYRIRLSAGLLMGPILMAAGIGHSPWLLAGAFVLLGMMNSLVVMLGYSRRIMATPRQFRARMTAINMLVPQLAATTGPAIVGSALAHFSIDTAYIACGAGMLICTLGYLFTPDFRMFLSIDDAQVEGWYERRYPQAFPPAALES